MDRKGVIVLIICFVLLLLQFQLINKFFPPVPAPELTNQVSRATNTTGLNTNNTAFQAPTNVIPAATNTANVTTNVPAPTAVSEDEKTVFIENDHIKLVLTSFGGGLKEMVLKKHPQVVGCGDEDTSANGHKSLNKGSPVPMLTLRGGPLLEDDGLYVVRREGRSTLIAEKQLKSGLYVIKTITLLSNYLFTADTRIENRGPAALALPAVSWVTGTATPIDITDDGMYVGTYWYDGNDEHHIDAGWFANRFLGCFGGTPRPFYDGGANTVGWTAVHNQFFTIAAIPDAAAERVTILETNLPPPSMEARQQNKKAVANPKGYVTAITYPGTNLAARAVMNRTFTVYAGPKEYNNLARLGTAMNNDLDLLMGYSGFFGFFAKALLLSMNGLAGMGLSYAMAIIVITIIIKILFWPLTNASTKSMKRMAALQPQMKAIQEKFKDDPAKMNRKLMEFMKEHKVSPLGGCLPMLLQIPVFFGFFQMIRSAIELRGASFLWVCDLSQPDTIAIIPGLEFPLNPLPIIMGVTMLWQARLTPASPGMDPAQQKLMRYLPLMFVFFLYNFSSGLTLYWTVQNILTIVQTKLTKTKDEPAKPGGPGGGTTPATPAGPAGGSAPTRQKSKSRNRPRKKRR